ncbi:MAG: M14 family metallopeptidase [Bacteroidales bacterium]|nr:M14 family metallopeptidase [Bacteroidales bacterium]
MSFLQERFTGSAPGPHLLITGGVHGDEFEPMAAIRRLIRHCTEHPLQAGTLTLVPIVNEPAFQRGNRVGDDGLDLARTCPGRADGSQTERIAHDLSNLIRSADRYIDLHTGGTRLQVLPLVGYGLHPTATVREEQRRMALAFGLPIIWGTDPYLEGRSLSVARAANVPAIYAEYLGGGGCDADGVAAYFQGCLRVLAYLGLIAEAPPAHPDAPRIVEDPRPGSGHMQVNHPAPCAGFLELCVTLGQPVTMGEQLGTITDPLGQQVIPIHAAYAGIVIVLHTFSRIDAGTSIAVILPDSVEPA